MGDMNMNKEDLISYVANQMNINKCILCDFHIDLSTDIVCFDCKEILRKIIESMRKNEKIERENNKEKTKHLSVISKLKEEILTQAIKSSWGKE